MLITLRIPEGMIVAALLVVLLRIIPAVKGDGGLRATELPAETQVQGPRRLDICPAAIDQCTDGQSYHYSGGQHGGRSERSWIHKPFLQRERPLHWNRCHVGQIRAERQLKPQD